VDLIGCLGYILRMLTINKIITPKQSGKTSTGKFIDYSHFDKYSKKQGGETIERNIQWYRMWYTFLKLALELEQKKIPVNNKLLKVNKTAYKQWNLNTILTTSFDKWWLEHRHLFVLEQVQIVKEIDDKKDYLYLKIPTNRNEQELFRELKEQLKGKLSEDVAKYPFSNSGTPYLSCHYQYNSLVMNINGKTGTQILDWCNEKYKQEIFGYEQSVSRHLVKGRKRLEDVCNLVFP